MGITPTSSSIRILAEVVKARHPQLADRVQRAVGIALQDGYTWGWSESEPDTLVVGKVERGEVEVTYHVNGTCTCPDYSSRAPEVAGQRWCKHRLARVLLLKAQAQQEVETPPVHHSANAWQQSMAWQSFARSYSK